MRHPAGRQRVVIALRATLQTLTHERSDHADEYSEDSEAAGSSDQYHEKDTHVGRYLTRARTGKPDDAYTYSCWHSRPWCATTSVGAHGTRRHQPVVPHNWSAASAKAPSALGSSSRT